MLSVIILWIYILITTIAAGALMIRIAGLVGIVKRDFVPQDLMTLMLAGLVFVTVYAQVWSLFGGVGLAANAALCVICVFGCRRLPGELRESFGMRICQGGDRRTGAFGKSSDGGKHYPDIDCGFIISGIFAAIVFLIMAYGTSHGYMHYDTGLYHAQAIHWIEDYGVVPGLANLHVRLGYNSSAFALNALYSFAFISGRSYHVTAGFWALLLAWGCVAHPVSWILRSHTGMNKAVYNKAGDDKDDGDKATDNKAGRRSPLTVNVIAEAVSVKIPSITVRVAGVYYLFMIFDEMVSPASDYYMVSLGFILIIRWTDALSSSDMTDRFCLLSMLACFILTIKLSGALFVLLAVIPAYMIIQRRPAAKGDRDVLTDSYDEGTGSADAVRAGNRSAAIRLTACIVTGALIVLPYLIRNVIISGWLLYPSTSFTLFHPDWQVPQGLAQYDFKEIQVYGRGYTDVGMYDLPIGGWISHWFGTLGATDKALMAVAVVGTGAFVVQLSLSIFAAAKSNKEIKGIKAEDIPQRKAAIYYATTIVVILCFVFWLTTSPLMRYGCLYVYLVCALTWGGVLKSMFRYRGMSRRIINVMSIVIVSGLCLLGIYKTAMWGIETVRLYRPDTWIQQQDYDTYEVTEYAIDKVTIYTPTEGDRTGYYAFPSSPVVQDIHLRGTDVADGFVP